MPTNLLPFSARHHCRNLKIKFFFMTKIKLFDDNIVNKCSKL